MDYFRSVTQTVLGTPQPGQQPSGADTVERLIDRVQSSTLLEDRRDGCRALKAMSRKYRVLVGAHAMDTLIQVLESDRNDHDIVNYSLETLVNVTGPEEYPEETEEELDPAPSDQSSALGEQFTEILTKRRENIELLVNLLDEFDFKVRYPTVKLLTNLLKNRPKDLQEVILVIPSGVSKLMDLLSDSREVIRNDTLLLLTQLTKSNTNLQKIVAFENCFDHLFQIIRGEGFGDGGVVVEDCLTLMLNLLRNNPSNQTFFKEGSYIQRLTLFFTLPLNSDEGWSAQKVTNIHYMLQLVRTLVAPHNSAQTVTSCQRVMSQCGLLAVLTSLLMASGVPVDILTHTINAVSDVIRGNSDNQAFFSGMMAPSSPPRTAIVTLLMSMVNDKQPFILRCAVLYCFQCYLYRNPSCQDEIISTLLPQTADASLVTSGQLLCSGLFSTDPVSNWFAAVALSHSLVDNPTQKEHMLRVQLTTSVGTPPVSLMQQCMSILQAGPKVLTRFGILMLLSTWLAHSTVAVQTFLAISAAIPYLTTHVSANEHDELEMVCQGLCALILGLCVQFNDGKNTSFSADSLRQLVSDRIGAETFSDKLSNISRIESYTKAAKSPQIAAKQPSELVFDHEFCRLFKSLEVNCVRAVTPQLVGGSSTEVTPAEVTQYKDMIRDQDAEITRLKESLASLEAAQKGILAEKDSLSTHLQQLSDENTVLKAQRGITIDATSSSTNEGEPRVEGEGGVEGTHSANITTLQQQLAEMTHARDYYYYEWYKKEHDLANLQQEQQEQTQKSSSVNGTQKTNEDGNTSGGADFFDNLSSNPDLENLRQQLEALQLVLYKKDSEIQQLQESVTNANTNIITLPTDNLNGFCDKQNNMTDNEATYLKEENESLRQQVREYEIHLRQVQTQLETSAAAVAAATAESAANKGPAESSAFSRCKQLEVELDCLKREQEDLLVLVTDQDSKVADYRRKLRAYGEEVTDDEDDDEDGENFNLSDAYDDDEDELQ